jgi:transcription factor SPN1
VIKTAKLAKDESVTGHPTLDALARASKRRKIEMTDEERQQAAHDLITLMLDVVEQDNASNAKRKPALQKLLNLEHVTKELRRIPIQEYFIEKGGCEALANWLYPLPDGTFPSVKVVQEIMSVIETLHIDPHFLEKDPKLARVIQVYAKNKASMH